MKLHTSMIWVTFVREGIHCYPDAEFNETLKDVKFLASPHRHLFHFKVHIEVFHDDRDIEFILFKRWLEGLYSTEILQLNNKSCEMIARDLYQTIIAKYPGREVWIDISEDGENGCFLQFSSQ